MEKIVQKTAPLKISIMGLGLLMTSGCTGEPPPVTKAYPEEGSSVWQLYLARCGDCHVAPQPGSHVAKMWPGILQRMQMRMQAKARTPLDKTELEMILDYVQRHARVDNTQ